MQFGRTTLGREGENLTIHPVFTVASTGKRAVAQTATNPTAVLVGRFGFATRGAVYVIVGWLALRAAVGAGAGSTDKQGALEAIAQQPFGVLLLTVVAIGLFAYAAWSLVRALFDPERHGYDASAWFARAGFAVAGLSYGGLAWAAAHLALVQPGVSEAGIDEIRHGVAFPGRST